MKKTLILTTLALALALVSCETPETGITAVTIKPAKATIAEGGNITLTAIATPAEMRGEYTWSSSDTTIAIVDQDGNVSGLSAGTAIITATEKGGLKAESEIKVTSYLESFSFGQVFLYGWSPNDTVGQPTYSIRGGNGTTFTCYKMPIDFLVCSEGFYIDNSGYYAGAEEALAITMPCYFYWAPANLNTDPTILVLGRWEIVKDSSEYYTMVGEPGVYGEGVLENVLNALDSYNNAAYTDFSQYLQAAGAATTGTTMTEWSYSCDEDDPTNCGYSTSYVPDAVIEEAVFDIMTGTEGSSQWMVSLDYAKFSFRQLSTSSWWGVDATYDEENAKFVINDRSKLLVSDLITMEFGEPVSYDVARGEENLIALPESVLPSQEVQENIARQIKEGKIRVVNMKRK